MKQGVLVLNFDWCLWGSFRVLKCVKLLICCFQETILRIFFALTVTQLDSLSRSNPTKCNSYYIYIYTALTQSSIRHCTLATVPTLLQKEALKLKRSLRAGVSVVTAHNLFTQCNSVSETKWQLYYSVCCYNVLNSTNCL